MKRENKIESTVNDLDIKLVILKFVLYASDTKLVKLLYICVKP